MPGAHEAGGVQAGPTTTPHITSRETAQGGRSGHNPLNYTSPLERKPFYMVVEGAADRPRSLRKSGVHLLVWGWTCHMSRNVGGPTEQRAAPSQQSAGEQVPSPSAPGK